MQEPDDDGKSKAALLVHMALAEREADEAARMLDILHEMPPSGAQKPGAGGSDETFAARGLLDDIRILATEKKNLRKAISSAKRRIGGDRRAGRASSLILELKKADTRMSETCRQLAELTGAKELASASMFGEDALALAIFKKAVELRWPGAELDPPKLWRGGGPAD
jgi:hypothetical protein